MLSGEFSGTSHPEWLPPGGAAPGPRGCLWQRLSVVDPPGLMDFPNIGVSETFDEAVAAVG
jgi:hypothetical protein